MGVGPIGSRWCAAFRELRLTKHWYERNALKELSGIPAERANEDRLSRTLFRGNLGHRGAFGQEQVGTPIRDGRSS